MWWVLSFSSNNSAISTAAILPHTATQWPQMTMSSYVVGSYVSNRSITFFLTDNHWRLKRMHVLQIPLGTMRTSRLYVQSVHVGTEATTMHWSRRLHLHKPVHQSFVFEYYISQFTVLVCIARGFTSVYRVYKHKPIITQRTGSQTYAVNAVFIVPSVRSFTKLS
jgi:hypothetical protein